MARHLDSRDIKAIVSLIQGWGDEKLTWNAICDAAEPLVGKRPTRQSLSAHESIATAYKVVSKGLRQVVPQSSRFSSLGMATDRVTKLEREIAQLQEENRVYKQQFVVWQYNLYKYGMQLHQMNEPLPLIDRERSDGEKR